MATAMASTHMRMRRQSAMFRMSVIAPIVQKLTRLATAPKTNASAKARPVTRGAIWVESCMAEIMSGPARPRFAASGVYRREAGCPPAAGRRAMKLHIGADAAARKSPIAMLAAALAAFAMLACGAASAHWPQSSLATLEVYDRQDGVTLPVYEKDGRRYVVGTPGHEYTLRIRNVTGQRVLAVTSVDGVN